MLYIVTKCLLSCIKIAEPCPAGEAQWLSVDPGTKRGHWFDLQSG